MCTFLPPCHLQQLRALADVWPWESLNIETRLASSHIQLGQNIWSGTKILVTLIWLTYELYLDLGQFAHLFAISIAFYQVFCSFCILSWQGHDCELMRYRVADNTSIVFEGRVGAPQKKAETKRRWVLELIISCHLNVSGIVVYIYIHALPYVMCTSKCSHNHILSMLSQS